MMPCLRLFALFALPCTVITSACSQTVIVRTDAPAHVTLDEQDLGEVDASGVEVEVGTGLFPVPYTVDRDGQKTAGEIARSRPAWLPNTAGLCGPFLTAPACACCGATCANPQLFASPFICVMAAVGGPDLAFGACYGLCAQLVLSPGWLSVPFGCAGTAVGMLPLALLGFGTLPDELVLVGPSATDAPPPAPDAAARANREAMAW